MVYENLSFEKEDHVMSINLPQVAKYHARTTQLANELSDTCTTMTQDKEMQAVISNREQEGPLSGTGLNEDIFTCGESGTKPRPLAA
jgi:hypothetical protein